MIPQALSNLCMSSCDAQIFENISPRHSSAEKRAALQSNMKNMQEDTASAYASHKENDL